MSQLYDIYKRNTFRLAKTIVIKLDAVNDAINNSLLIRGYNVSEYDKTTHKYYKNLAGEYHIADHDELLRTTGSRYIMVDVATDTATTQVAFTKELLHGVDANRSLLNEYHVGSRYYEELISKYPTYRTLINGIINPIDIQTAVKSSNGSILSIANRQIHLPDDTNEFIHYKAFDYTKNTQSYKLIEPQEDNLIFKLQDWVYNTLQRWVVKDYFNTDNLYAAFILGVIAANLPGKIFNIRWGNTHTARAHSFHIAQYLDSHGQLGKFIPFIPMQQVLYLYRNLRYLNNNMGKQFTFTQLVENMLTPTQVPIAGYYIQHDTSDMNDASGNMIPDTNLISEPINFSSLGAKDNDRTVKYILQRQSLLARENDRFIEETEREIKQKVGYSGDSELNTKVLESSMVDIADPIPVTLYNQLLWYWAFCSSKSLYTGSIFVSNPVNGERISLTPLKAFILMLYCLNLAEHKRALEFIPTNLPVALWITRDNDSSVKPDGFSHVYTLDEHKQYVDSNYISDSTIKRVMGNFKGRYRASDPSSFLQMVKEHHEELARSYLVCCRVEDLYARGFAENIFRQKYWFNIPINLASANQRYDEWILKLGIDFKHFGEQDYYRLSEQICIQALGLTDNVGSKRSELQKAMISILEHFTSYTTHFIYSANEQEVINSWGKYLRMSNHDVQGEAGLKGGIYSGLDLFNDGGIGLSKHHLDTKAPAIISHGVGDSTLTGGFGEVGTNFSEPQVVFAQRANMHSLQITGSILTGEKRVKYKTPKVPNPVAMYNTNYYLSDIYLTADEEGLVDGLTSTIKVTAGVTEYPDIHDNMSVSVNKLIDISIYDVTDYVDTNYSDNLIVGIRGNVDISVNEVKNDIDINISKDEISTRVLAGVQISISKQGNTKFVDNTTSNQSHVSAVVSDTIKSKIIDSVEYKDISVSANLTDATIYKDKLTSNMSINTSIKDFSFDKAIEDSLNSSDAVTSKITTTAHVFDSNFSISESVNTQGYITVSVTDQNKHISSIGHSLSVSAGVFDLTSLNDFVNHVDSSITASVVDSKYMFDSTSTTKSTVSIGVSDYLPTILTDDINATSNVTAKAWDTSLVQQSTDSVYTKASISINAVDVAMNTRIYDGVEGVNINMTGDIVDNTTRNQLVDKLYVSDINSFVSIKDYLAQPNLQDGVHPSISITGEVNDQDS